MGNKSNQYDVKEAKWLAPTHIRVAVPQPVARPPGRGVQSLTKYGVNLPLRLSREQLATINREAEQLGLSASAYARWALVELARVLYHERTGEHDATER